MNENDIILFVVAALAFASGFLTAYLIFRPKMRIKGSKIASGNLVIDYTNPDTDVYRLEITDDISTLPLKECIVFNVITVKGDERRG